MTNSLPPLAPNQFVFIKTPQGTKTCFVVDLIKNEKTNKATIKVKGIVESLCVTTNIEISDFKAFEEHKEVQSSHGYFRLLKPVIHEGNVEISCSKMPMGKYQPLKKKEDDNTGS